MKKVFSYSLFEPKILPNIRTWDKWKNNSTRYWFNIPTIALLNKILFPEYECRFYLSPNIWDNPLSKIFEIFDNIKCETINREYSITEPAIWRMMPLWERTVAVFHSRDVDSLSTIEEYKYIKTFENSNCLVGTIRSHENHYGIACRMLAGLSSFKPNQINPAVKGINFDFYYALKDNNYGSDQNLMIKLFTKNKDFTNKYFLDYKIDKQVNKQDFECIEADTSNIVVDENIKNIFSFIRKESNTTWLGEPCDSRGNILKYLLNSNKNIKQKIINNVKLKEFYGL
jgi:hypothetical protein